MTSTTAAQYQDPFAQAVYQEGNTLAIYRIAEAVIKDALHSAKLFPTGNTEKSPEMVREDVEWLLGKNDKAISIDLLAEVLDIDPQPLQDRVRKITKVKF